MEVRSVLIPLGSPILLLGHRLLSLPSSPNEEAPTREINLDWISSSEGWAPLLCVITIMRWGSMSRSAV